MPEILNNHVYSYSFTFKGGPPSYRIYFKFPKIGGASGSTQKFPHVKLSELWPPEQHCVLCWGTGGAIKVLC